MSEGALYHLPDAALINALEAWDIPKVVSVKPLRGGFSSDVWKLDLPNKGSLVAKFAYDTQAVLEMQLQMSEFLAGRSLPVPKPIRARSGDLCVMVEGPPAKFHPLGVMTFIRGDHVEVYNEEAQVVSGRLLTQIHTEMSGADFVGRDPKWFYNYLEDENEPIANEDLVRPISREILAAVRAFETAHEVTRGIILGDDLHLMLHKETRTYGVVDLGQSIFGPLAYDVAITQMAIESRGYSPDAFVDAYFTNSPVTELDRVALPLYARMRLANLLRWVAWRELHESGYQPAEREANERRFWKILRGLEAHE